MRWPRLMPLGLGLMTLSVSGCETELSRACPQLVVYDQATLAQAEVERQQIPHGVIRDQMLPDYGRLRDQVRACEEGK